MVHDDGEVCRVTHRPRLCSNDSQIVCEAALKEIGIALLHEESCREGFLSGSLVRVLPQWHTAEGVLHMIFAPRRGMSAAQRALIDHYAERAEVVSTGTE